MKKNGRMISLILTAVLLTGCGTAGETRKPMNGSGMAEATAPPAEEAAPLMSPGEEAAGTAEILSGGAAASSADPFVFTSEHHVQEAFDPENGTERILVMEWDSIRLESGRFPETAGAITEAMAAAEERWYTGNGTDEWDITGYQNMLAAAEDDYGFAREYGAQVMEYSATREVRPVRMDETACVFLVIEYYYLGGAHGSYCDRAYCYDSQTGARLTLEDLAADPAQLKDGLLREMLHLVEEDTEGYYEEQLSLTERENYPEALGKLLREGSWYPGEDGIHVFSDIYELGPYYTGITDFLIPYEQVGLSRLAPVN